MSGLSKIVKAPRNTSIKGQPHKLAYITPEEGQILKSLGGAGKAGPQGIPSYYYDAAGMGGSSAGVGRDDDVGSTANFSSDESNSSAGDDSPTPVSDSGASQYRPGAGSYQKQLVQDMPETRRGGIAGFLSNLFGGRGNENTARDYYQKRIAAGTIDPDTGMSTVQTRGLDSLANQYNRNYKLPGALGGLFNTIAGKNVEAMTNAIQRGGIPQFDSKGNVRYVEMPNGQIVGTAPTPTSSMFQSDNSDQTSLSQMGSQIAQAQQAATSGIPSGNNAYYARGVGTATVDMSDPAQRQAYLANLTTPTASPIGATYDPIKKQYILPDGTKIDANTGQKIKMSGLDIFKRLDKIGLLQEGGSVGSAQSFGNTNSGLMNILPQIRQAMIMQYDQQRVRPALQQIGSALSQYSPQGGNQSSFGQNAFGSGQNAFNQQMQQQQQQVQRGSVGGVGKPTTLNTTQNFKQMPTLEDVYKGAVASGTFG